MKEKIKAFQKTVWDFYKKNKREFPWRNITNPYHILVSEVMLQQTQADRVVRFYEKWLQRFPDFETLAKATFSEIYPFWQGLGYNRRAMALQKTAQKAVAEFNGKLPAGVGHLQELEKFPGIGPYTARAVSIFSYNTPVACIETNIRRVFIHHFFKGKENVTDKEILEIAERACPAKPWRSREWHWALMDYGSHLRSTLSLSKGGNPNKRHKNYAVQSKFEGSLRQIRGAALRILSGETADSKTLVTRIKKACLIGRQATSEDAKRIKSVLLTLEKEGLIIQNNKLYSLN